MLCLVSRKYEGKKIEKKKWKERKSEKKTIYIYIYLKSINYFMCYFKFISLIFPLLYIS